ncbi:hypothetical protein CPB86DRAFT_787797 [Serendipita vermifera]|nr:hypothetical protein CPB86DRAFT_787797 [Serendipita vermifera]
MLNGRSKRAAIPSTVSVIQPNDDLRITLPRRKQKPSKIILLPPEILCNIFANALSLSNYDYVGSILNNRTAIMLVSKLFYQIVISNPFLWALIPVSGPLPNIPAIERMICLAGQVISLHFHFDLRTEGQEDEWCDPQMMDCLVGGYLVPNIQRVERLTFIVDRMFVVNEIQSRLSTLSAPILKHFKIVLGDLSILLPLHIDDPCAELDEPLPFFSGAHPELQYLTLHWVPLNYVASTMANLTELDLSLQEPLPPSLFIKFISTIPRLRSLTLRNTGPAFEERDQQSQTVNLPHLRRLVLGAMHAQYIEYLLSMLQFPPLQELGIHAIYEHMAEDVWRCLAKYERRHLFGSIQTLELFDVEESLLMEQGLPNSFVHFLSPLHRLKHLRMRKVTLGFLSVLQTPVNLHLIPALEALEVCCVVKKGLQYDWEDSDDRLPVEMDVIADNLVEIIRDRSARRPLPILNLDEGEWRPEKRARFFLRLLGESRSPIPIIHWDARAPFFNDFYDSNEL